MNQNEQKSQQKGQSPTQVIGSNGVALATHNYKDDGYRTFEVYQRERVGESTEKINGADLASATFASDPYPALSILREHYPCYRDWVNNRYWISRYDDVTSILTDNANFETRSKRWFYGMPTFGRDLSEELPVLEIWATGYQQNAQSTADALCARLLATDQKVPVNFAVEFAAQFAIQLLAKVVGVADDAVDRFATLHWRAQRGVGWLPEVQQAGRDAIADLVSFFDAQMASRQPGDTPANLMDAILSINGDATDLVATLLESDHQTLHGASANLWYLLLTHPDELQRVQAESRLLKTAYLETLRHSTPIIFTQRFAKHEVERFGRLLPRGASLTCAAAAANRDPRQFSEPDRFIAERRDICHREARGQYRADGLATGIAVGLGTPTIHPAVPEDRPISRYALTRDAVVSASAVVIEQLKNLRLSPDAKPTLRSLSIGEMHTCWSLPVLFDR